MVCEIQCKTCGRTAWGRTESFGDDRCDDCINKSQRIAELAESTDGPPEFREGRIAYVKGISRWDNPYYDKQTGEDICGMGQLWDNGWTCEEKG